MNTDYERIASAIGFIADHVEAQPSLAELAAHLQMSPFHLQRLFTRWAGVSPKRFLQVLTVGRAKALLEDGRPVLEVADAVGLSSGSRLHDHFVYLEAVTPGEFRRAGESLLIDYGVHATPFGSAFIAVTPRGVCKVAFVDGGDRAVDPLAELNAQWPGARIRADQGATADVAGRMFASHAGADGPVSLYVRGTNFQVSVWRALLGIAPGQVTTYSGVARATGRSGASRAVGGAVGANPVAFFIPCHRVIAHNGGLGGYRWGTTRKQAMQLREAVRETTVTGQQSAARPRR